MQNNIHTCLSGEEEHLAIKSVAANKYQFARKLLSDDATANYVFDNMPKNTVTLDQAISMIDYLQKREEVL